MAKKKCFVVMGFGEKPDYATGRTLDLDKTYRIIIKKAVEEAGLECIRADDIVHAGIIDKPMYEMLYGADLVVADLSTSNLNAIYELGVRHALKPRTTIVIAEKQFKFPFDIKSLLIRPYEHLGKGIDSEEADKVREELKKAILTLIDKEDETDSPVYTFMTGLATPVLSSGPSARGLEPPAEMPKKEDSLDVWMESYKEARKSVKIAADWLLCIGILRKMLEKKPNDVYLNQQLALATYKSKSPSAAEALDKAKAILSSFNPYQTTDPETLGLWGAIYKRYWDLEQNKPHLNEAIWAYEKGFYLKDDFYNGINFAFLLNLRASISEKRNAIADAVIAERTRRRVIALCNDVLDKGVKDENGNIDKEQQFWIQATLAEAYVGTGEQAKAEQLIQEIAQTVPEQWMLDSMNDQLNKLKELLKTVPECN